MDAARELAALLSIPWHSLPCPGQPGTLGLSGNSSLSLPLGVLVSSVPQLAELVRRSVRDGDALSPELLPDILVRRGAARTVFFTRHAGDRFVFGVSVVRNAAPEPYVYYVLEPLDALGLPAGSLTAVSLVVETDSPYGTIAAPVPYFGSRGWKALCDGLGVPAGPASRHPALLGLGRLVHDGPLRGYLPLRLAGTPGDVLFAERSSCLPAGDADPSFEDACRRPTLPVAFARPDAFARRSRFRIAASGLAGDTGLRRGLTAMERRPGGEYWWPGHDGTGLRVAVTSLAIGIAAGPSAESPAQKALVLCSYPGEGGLTNWAVRKVWGSGGEGAHRLLDLCGEAFGLGSDLPQHAASLIGQHVSRGPLPIEGWLQDDAAGLLGLARYPVPELFAIASLSGLDRDRVVPVMAHAFSAVPSMSRIPWAADVELKRYVDTSTQGPARGMLFTSDDGHFLAACEMGGTWLLVSHGDPARSREMYARAIGTRLAAMGDADWGWPEG